MPKFRVVFSIQGTELTLDEVAGGMLNLMDQTNNLSKNIMSVQTIEDIEEDNKNPNANIKRH